MAVRHDFGDFTQLGAVGAHEEKAVFFALRSGRVVVFGSRCRKQEPLCKAEMIALCKGPVGSGPQTQQPSARFQD